MAAPRPVLTPQARPTTSASGVSGGTLTAVHSGTTANSAKDAWYDSEWMGSPPLERRVVPSSMVPVSIRLVSHRPGSPRTQK